VTERHTSNRGLEKYFGLGGPFSEASAMVRANSLPGNAVNFASELGNSETAYKLGYAFGMVLKKRSLRITRDDVTQIAWMKISSGEPALFEKGFWDFQAKDRAG
jgi:hypothetical protein